MKKIIFTLLLTIASINVTAEQVCHKCEMIREENKKKVNPYEYYEDFIKAHPEEANKTPVNDAQDENDK